MDTVHECDRRTDGRTDGQTDGQNYLTKTVLRIASHGNEGCNNCATASLAGLVLSFIACFIACFI